MNFSLKKCVAFVARTDVFFFALLWLIVLLAVGTISQKSIGLYAAQEKYFASWVVWIGDLVPVPGGAAVMSIIFAGLLAKVFLQKWGLKDAGTLIVHVGAILLLFGGFLTARFSYEGNMVIAEGEEISYISDYHDLELAVTDTDKKTVIHFPETALVPGAVLSDPDLPFTITLEDYCENCALMRRKEPLSTDEAHGMIVNIALQPIPRAKQDEQNLTGITFKVKDAGEGVDGLYAIFKNMPITQTLSTTDGSSYTLELRPVRVPLPFALELVNFERTFHPGTMMPKSYSAEVILKDNGLKWHSLIEMNRPLRYKGYTFYQSSFIADGRDETTVLAVVKNMGRLFPYISSIIMCIGLLVHLGMHVPLLMKGREETKNA